MSDFEIADSGFSARELPHIASRIFNAPLLIMPDKLQAIVWSIQHHFGIAGVARPENESVMLPAAGPARWETVDRGTDTRRPSGMFIDKGVAVLPITGTLVNRGSWIGTSSGLQSYEGIAQQLRMAADDPRVQQILLDINSYGGEAGGVSDLAAEIRELSQLKPVTALIADAAASAAYWLASAASLVVAQESSMGGSIGVVMTHQDVSGMAEKKGIKITHIHAGANKVIGSPFKPLSDSDKSTLQAMVDNLYEMFTAGVASYRGDKLTQDAAKQTEASVYTGQQLVDKGLADEVMTGRALLKQMQLNPNGGIVRRSYSMSTEKKGTIAVANTDDLRLALAAGYPPDGITIDHSKAESAAQAKGREEGALAAKTEAEVQTKTRVEAAAKDERTRLSALAEIAEPGFEAEHKAAIEAGHTPEQFALTQMKAAKDRGVTIGAIRKDSPRAVHASAPEEQRQAFTEAKAGWGKAVAKLGGKKAA